LNYFPGEEEFVDRAAKAKARGRVELDTLDREVERPSIMDATPAAENALVRQLRERRINTEKGLRKGPSSEGRNDIRKVPPDEDIDPLAKTVEGQPPRLEDDPRLVDQKERVGIVKELMKRYANQKATSDKLSQYIPGTKPKGNRTLAEIMGTERRRIKTAKTIETEALLDRLMQQEDNELSKLMTELMNENMDEKKYKWMGSKIESDMDEATNNLINEEMHKASKDVVIDTTSEELHELMAEISGAARRSTLNKKADSVLDDVPYELISTKELK
jgi:hypothetical protein